MFKGRFPLKRILLFFRPHIVRAQLFLLSMVFAPVSLAYVDLVELETSSIEAVSEQLLNATEDQGRLHLALGYLKFERAPEFSLQHFHRAADLLDEADTEARTMLAGYMCIAYLAEGNVELARTNCVNAVNLSETTDSTYAKAKAHGTQALFHFRTGNLELARASSQVGVGYAEQSGSLRLAALAYNNTGLFERALGMHKESIRYFEQAIRILDVLNDETLSHLASFNVGLAYADMGEHELAKSYFLPTHAWAVENQLYRRELTALLYISLSDIALGRGAIARDALAAALQRPEFHEDKGYAAFAYGVYGEALVDQGDTPGALAAFETAIELSNASPTTFEQRLIHTGYAKALAASDRLEEAIAVSEETVAALRRTSTFVYLPEAISQLAALKEKAGLHYESVGLIREQLALEAKLGDEALKRELARARAEFEVDEKEKALLQADRERIVLIGMLMLLVAFSVIGYLAVSRKTVRARSEAQAEYSQQLEAEVARQTRELKAKIAQIEEAERLRAAMEEQLVEAEKLRVLGQLTGGVAHDFNNLLTVVLGAADVLKQTEDVALRGKLVSHISSAAQSGAGITKALMAYARKQPLALETVNLREMLEETVPMIARTLGGAQTIDLEIPSEGDFEVVIDEGQMTSALLNLCLNAKDAQDGKGRIVVTLSELDSGEVCVSVQDFGIGMRPEEIARAIEPFYSTKAESQGNGLGLSMVYGFSKQIGGDLKIDSELGEGTTVRILLPRRSTTVREIDLDGMDDKPQGDQEAIA